jgi:holo-[acyl-carrier protein] synthase
MRGQASARHSVVRVGVDVVAVERVARALVRTPSISARVFAPGEGGSAMRPESAAGVYAAKEAVIKVLGRRVPLTDIRVERGSRGPTVSLQGRGREVADSMGLRGLDVSITHDAGVAIAVAVGVFGRGA